MKILKFDGTSKEDRETYRIFAMAIRLGEMKGAEQVDRTLKTMRKLNAIGVEKRIPAKDENNQTVMDDDDEVVMRSVWSLASDGGTLELEDAEYDELKTRMSATSWASAAVERIAVAQAFLKNAEVEKKTAGASRRAGK